MCVGIFPYCPLGGVVVVFGRLLGSCLLCLQRGVFIQFLL